MSSVGDAFSGATSGVTDQTLSDASLGSDIMGGGSLADTGSSLFGGGGSSFNSVSDLANALSGGGYGGSPNAAQSIAMNPPSAAAATGGDPTGAAGGTQSATAPGAQPAAQSGGGGQPNQNQQQSQHAPESAVDQLRQLLKGLQGKPQGPTGQIPLPGVSRGQTGAQSPQAPQGGDPLSEVAGAPPAGARTPPGAASAPDPTVTLPGLAKGETGPPSPTAPQTDAQGNPLTVAGTRADQTPTPPPRPAAGAPSTTGGKPTPKTDDQGRPITVQPKAQPKTATTADLPTRVPHPDTTKLPTHKPGPSPAPAATMPATTQIQRDIAGVSTGSPTALADLAHAAMALAPLIGMFMGGGRGGRFGHFRGGRFTRGVGGFRGFGGGMRAMGFHPGGSRAWPYHHPQMGWDMHHMHPGGGWLPMHPRHAAEFGYYPGMGAGQQDGSPDPTANQDPNALDPNKPPPQTDEPEGGGPGKPTNQVGGEASPDDIMATIRQRESGNRYNLAPFTDPKTGQYHDASGAYQFKPGTWRQMAQESGDEEAAKYREAYQAPPEVQDRMARYAMMKYGPNASITWQASGPNLGRPYPNPTGGSLASRTQAPRPRQISTTQPQHLAPAAAIPTTLPPSSTGMVAGP